jgi:hypothetical protein
MDNSVNTVIVIDELNVILEKIKQLIIMKAQSNNDYDTKIKKLYDEYKQLSKSLSI